MSDERYYLISMGLGGWFCERIIIERGRKMPLLAQQAFVTAFSEQAARKMVTDLRSMGFMSAAMEEF